MKTLDARLFVQHRQWHVSHYSNNPSGSLHSYIGRPAARHPSALLLTGKVKWKTGRRRRRNVNMVTVVMARRRRDGRNWSSSSRLIFPPGQQVISERWTTARHQSNKPTMSTFIDRMDGNKMDVCLPGKKQMMNPAARGCLLIYINNNRSVLSSLFYNVSISTL